MPSRYVATLHSVGLRVELLVNDIPLVYVTPAENSPTVVPLNAFSFSGRNTVSLLVHAAPSAARAELPWKDNALASIYMGPGQCTLSISRVEDGPSSAERVGPELGTLSWSGEATPMPLRVDGTFTITEPLGPWRWQEADEIGSQWMATQREVTAYIERLHDMLRAGQFGDFITESEVKIRELASAFGSDPEALRAGLRNQLELHAKPSFVLMPLNPSVFELRRVAGGRLVQCSGPNRGQLLEYRKVEGQGRFFLPLTVGRDRGGWKVFR
jgi:hypothetical protein